MKDGKIAVEINVRKLLIVAGMAAGVWLASLSGEGEALLFILPAGIAGLVSKNV